MGNDDINESPRAFQAHACPTIMSVKSTERWTQGWLIATALRQALILCSDQTLGCNNNTDDEVGDMGLLLTSLISKAAPVQEILFTFMGGAHTDHRKEDPGTRHPPESINITFQEKDCTLRQAL